MNKLPTQIIFVYNIFSIFFVPVRFQNTYVLHFINNPEIKSFQYYKAVKHVINFLSNQA